MDTKRDKDYLEEMAKSNNMPWLTLRIRCTTIFFKRQSDILNLLIKDDIIANSSEILMPSYICSEVINSFVEKNLI